MGGYAAAAGLVDPKRLRAVALAARHDAAAFARNHEADPALVDAVAAPFETVDDAHDRLTALEALLVGREDRRAVFLTVYTRMTRAVREWIGRGRFDDTAWIRRYTVAFANYYRRAFLAFERGALGDVPDPWLIAFGTAVDGRAFVVQDTLLGVNAHINYDLALTLRDVGIDPDRATKRRDHRTINDLLARLVDAQQAALADLYDPGVANLDATLGRLDESFSLFSLTEGREQAWRVAVVLADVGVAPVASYARWLLRTTATGGALFVLAPTADRELVETLAWAERRRVDLDSALQRTRERMDAVDAT